MQSSSRRGIRIHLLAVVVVSNGIPPGLVSAVPPATWTSLSASPSFAAWRKDHEGWKIVGDVILNSDRPSRFEEKPGSGLLVSNGEASNLESQAEYQDVDVRLEFMIPRKSNSGVKLLGRYEIQILDTYDAKQLSGDSCGGIYPR